MMRLLLVAAVLAVVTADHAFVYLGYDHILDYDKVTGESRAFDFRRNLDKSSTCDFFVNPPLIEKAKFVDVLSSNLPTENAVVSYLGKEDFLVNHLDTGDFVIRRCSGFMPQQKKLPCEVITVGKNESPTGVNKYFFAGNHLVLKWVKDTRNFDILYYDWDVHGSGNPLHVRVSGLLPFTPSNTSSFAYLSVSDTQYMVYLDETTGFFSVRKFDPSRDSQRVFGEVVMQGNVLPGYALRTLDENNAVLYHPVNGDYEVWRVSEEENKLAIETVKQANISEGHSCMAETRYQCISQPGCGWCGESIRCHPIDANRKPCDGSLCANIVDAYSPDYLKYQKFEKPNPAYVIEYDDPPAESPRSYLRDLSKNGANPIIRESDLESEKIEGVEVNPSEGLVFIPPPNAVSKDTMDKDQLLGSSMNQVEPDVIRQEHLMNTVQGKKLAYVHTSPEGAAQTAPKESDLANPENQTGAVNTIVGFVPPTGKGAPEEALSNIPDLKKNTQDEAFKPDNDGTAKEEDLMNGVRSHYSSLIPKGGSLSVSRADSAAKPPPATDEKFAPRDTAPVWKKKAAPGAMIPPAEGLMESTKMETGVNKADYSESGLGSPVQNSAMTNAQFTSINMHTPHFANPADTTKEHASDLTGIQSPTVHQLTNRNDEAITEGFHVAEVPLTSRTQEWATVSSHEDIVVDLPKETTTTDSLRESKQIEKVVKKDVAVQEQTMKADALESKVSNEAVNGELKTESFEKGATNLEKTN